MPTAKQILQDNVRLLRTKASRQAIGGTIIASVAVVVATLVSAYIGGHYRLSVEAIVVAQTSNPVLWILDATPFVFGFWGQYTSTVLAYEAGAMVMDQTSELRTQTAALENRISHESTHDPLTGLPNRVLFVDRLEQALHLAHSTDAVVGVIFLDLDGFKEINDTLGHYSGDRVLKSVATRIQHAVAEPITVARVGGDEFGVVLPRLASAREVAEVAGALRRALDAPYALEGVALALSASVGATVFPEHGKDADTLMQRAEIAMYQAKGEKSGYALYSPEFDKRSPHRLILLGELRHAVQRQELLLLYQPIMSADGSMPRAEALVRWNHQRHGLIQPDEFVPLAERSGMINEITAWAIRHALQDVAAWHRDGLDVNVSVNVTAQSLLDPEFADVVAGLLASYELPDNPLTLEITETTLLTDQTRALETITRLRELGVHTTIDDFGTGYSSLAYLRKLPISGIKIDRSFVSDLNAGEGGEILINAILGLAHALRLHVTAEGVEDADTAERLKRLGCDALQGFYMSEPLGAAQLEEWSASPRAGDGRVLDIRSHRARRGDRGTDPA